LPAEVSAGIAERLRQVNHRIAAAARRSGRDPKSIEVIAVTKGVAVDTIREAIVLGLKRLGENRMQEALPKVEALRSTRCEWHLIGHLQTNKVKFVEGNFSMVQSLDSVHLAEALAHRISGSLDVLIEVNVGEEEQKTGVMPRELDELVESVGGLPVLRLKGLMTIAPMTNEPESVRPAFRRLREMRDELAGRLGCELPVLSMGMTDDFEVAVEEGATMLRLGRALFQR
jgi:pyridoxal phosphate enzyme (YggS family)